ncbi:MAG: helix-turn-helix transcriptional regulator [Chloroflexota bacterium]|nr:helix-turn-helix transcriptional regulator [Chloroflexota bacterium]
MNPHSSVLLQFGNKLRKLRIERNLSQEDLAALCQLDRTYISGIERGKRNVSLKNIAVIAVALQISLTALFEDIGTDEQTTHA